MCKLEWRTESKPKTVREVLPDTYKSRSRVGTLSQSVWRRRGQKQFRKSHSLCGFGNTKCSS